MTCREKYYLDHPEMSDNDEEFPPLCPDHYGYLRAMSISDPNGYCVFSCETCWNREILDRKE